jgi:hypothetical protein
LNIGVIAYRDKKVVGVFVRFRAPLHSTSISDFSKPNAFSSLTPKRFKKITI